MLTIPSLTIGAKSALPINNADKSDSLIFISKSELIFSLSKLQELYKFDSSELNNIAKLLFSPLNSS